MGDSEDRTRAAHHTEILRLLLEHGAPADPFLIEEHGESYGRSALFTANAEETQLLLRYGANPNAEDNDYDTPLLWAVYDGDLRKAKLLLQYGADPNHEGALGSALQIATGENATEKRNAAMIALLKKAGAKE
jgi:ankyrin repeat protein